MSTSVESRSGDAGAARPARTVARAGVAALALVLLVALPGCGAGHGYGYDPWYGTLEVVNDVDSFWGIDAVEITAAFGPTEGFGVYLAPGEAWEVDLDPDEYEVRLLWSNGDEDVYYEWIGDGDWVTIVGWN